MTSEEAQEYAKTMSYKEAVMNCIYAKGIAYRKASLIKLQELAEIADKLRKDNDMTREEAIEVLKERYLTCVGIGLDNHANRVNEALDMAIEALSAEPKVFTEDDYWKALSADAVQGYTEWLEKIIVEAETFEWLCEDTHCKEWCDENCHYKSIQVECLRHLYEVGKGGDTE